MVRVAIAGFGFMGSMHFRCYKAMKGVEIVALCDIDKNKFTIAAGTAGNIAGSAAPLDLSGIELFSDFTQMLSRANPDAVSITLPTYLHAGYTVEALEAGSNVLCEKPMALNVKDCERMAAAADKNGRLLQIGQCIRFWPEYVKTKEIIDSGRYGRVKAATFQRLAMPPLSSWQHWMMDAEKSGGASLDLHIHDSDYIRYVFGDPAAVASFAVRGDTGDYDHIVTHYIYDDDKVVTAEGGWMMTNSFGFEMSFNIVLEQAVISYDCTRSPAFRVCPADGDNFTPQIEAGDGYSREIAYFVEKLSGGKVEDIIPARESLRSLKLVLAEKESARSGKRIKLTN